MGRTIGAHKKTVAIVARMVGEMIGTGGLSEGQTYCSLKIFFRDQFALAYVLIPECAGKLSKRDEEKSDENLQIFLEL